MTMRISKDRVDMDDKILRKPVLEDYGETCVTANSGTSYTINLTTGNVFNITLTDNCSFTFSNPPASGSAGSFTLFLTQDATGGRTVTWPGAVSWKGGTAPTLGTAPGDKEVLVFFTVNGGTDWYGSSISRLSGSVVEFSYPNSDSWSVGATLVSCAVTSNEVYLTTTAASDVGNIYRTSTKQYNRNFSVQWVFECSGGTGADGFCLQWTTTNNTNGTSGSGLSRITTALHALSFFTYSAGTPGLGWYLNNALQGSVQTNAISWRQNVFYWADYDHAASTMKIYYSTSGTKPGSPNHTLSSFSFDSTGYYIGFGAATGGSTDNHRLKAWTLIFR